MDQKFKGRLVWKDFISKQIELIGNVKNWVKAKAKVIFTARK